MRPMQNTARLFLALTVFAVPRANSLAEEKKMDDALMEPVKSVLNHYLAIHHEAYCPMVKASWLQTDRAIRNPYMGRAMLSCGELKN